MFENQSIEYKDTTMAVGETEYMTINFFYIMTVLKLTLLKKQVDDCRYLDSNILLNLRYDSKKATYYPIDSTEGK
jgi:hypothetical protein